MPDINVTIDQTSVNATVQAQTAQTTVNLGTQGKTGIHVGTTPPTDTTLLWVDTN